LHLPSTKFSVRKGLPKNADLITWQLYNHQLADPAREKDWVLHSGPPFAQGRSHLGHFYNQVLKDVVNRFKLMQGFKVHNILGFDCHGANIEHVALKNCESTDPSEQREICRDYVKDSILS
jgi:isoleucyl-tRNA synthetase